MGCVSSKLFRKDLRQEILFGNGDCTCNHVVSLTSSTYGVLKLDKDQHQLLHHHQPPPIREVVTAGMKRSPPLPPREVPEVINAWELMEDLEEEAHVSVQVKKSPKPRVFLRGIGEMDARSPLKFLNQMASPKKSKRLGGKENKRVVVNRFSGGVGRWDYSPKAATLKTCNLPENSLNTPPNLRIPTKDCSGSDMKSDSLTIDLGVLSRRRSLSPLFDPELISSFEKELSEQEQIKKMVSATPISVSRRERNSRDSAAALERFERKCPPGGENAVVLYTTTLRGIRKTFEDCNNARSIIESHRVQMFERDVSMDSGFREELRGILGEKDLKVPVVFVKGRLIGGAEEVVKLEEEGKFGILLDGIPRAVVAACNGCAGIRFVMCTECNGSCKVLGEDGKKTIKCGECNENGLIQCPICC